MIVDVECCHRNVVASLDVDVQKCDTNCQLVYVNCEANRICRVEMCKEKLFIQAT